MSRWYCSIWKIYMRNNYKTEETQNEINMLLLLFIINCTSLSEKRIKFSSILKIQITPCNFVTDDDKDDTNLGKSILGFKGHKSNTSISVSDYWWTDRLLIALFIRKLERKNKLRFPISPDSVLVFNSCASLTSLKTVYSKWFFSNKTMKKFVRIKNANASQFSLSVHASHFVICEFWEFWVPFFNVDVKKMTYKFLSM